jgi:hypothetical protein
LQPVELRAGVDDMLSAIKAGCTRKKAPRL